MGRVKESLFAHALNFQKSWEIGNRKLLCYIRTIVMSECQLTATSSAHFLTNDGSLLIIRSPVPSSYISPTARYF